MTFPIDDTHDPARVSWIESANGHADFPIQNLPFGVFSPPGGRPRGGVAVGRQIIDMSTASRSKLLDGEARIAAQAASGECLNPFLALEPRYRQALRHRLSELLTLGSPDRAQVETWRYASVDCEVHLPARIGDYTDFYAGIHHALNVGKQFRPDAPLMPNYKHIPIGYHGRSSSVRPSGSPVRRPNGQTKGPDAILPAHGPSKRLDMELELGIWIGQGNVIGEPIPIASAREHIAGLSLLNDWSARDIQAWEYQPLGPFLAKSFMTTVSPWIVTAEALAPFRIAQPPRPRGDPAPLAYLSDVADQAAGAYAIDLQVLLSTAEMRRQGIHAVALGEGPASNLYWTTAQLVTHQTSNGCNLNPGDLLGTGTISTADDSGLGSLLELTKGGQKPIELPTGEARTFLEDGDEVTLVGRASAKGYAGIGFGECRGIITPALTR